MHYSLRISLRFICTNDQYGSTRFPPFPFLTWLSFHIFGGSYHCVLIIDKNGLLLLGISKISTFPLFPQMLVNIYTAKWVLLADSVFNHLARWQCGEFDFSPDYFQNDLKSIKTFQIRYHFKKKIVLKLNKHSHKRKQCFLYKSVRHFVSAALLLTFKTWPSELLSTKVSTSWCHNNFGFDMNFKTQNITKSKHKISKVSRSNNFVWYH